MRGSGRVSTTIPSSTSPIPGKLTPAAWNRRALQMGGGGYDGTVPNIVGNVFAGPADTPNPIGRGYAVFGSDSGHEGASNNGSFDYNCNGNEEMEWTQGEACTGIYWVCGGTDGWWGGPAACGATTA